MSTIPPKKIERDRNTPNDQKSAKNMKPFWFGAAQATNTSSQHGPEVISFGPFRLYPSERVLKKADQPVKIGSRAFDILLVLVQHAGEVVGHKELVAKVWPGVFVEEVSLRVHIAALRKALDTGEAGARYLTHARGAARFVELGPLSAPHLLAGTVASAFGLPVQSQDPIPGLVAHLRGKRTLLILDSPEHLISQAAVVAERLFSDLPDLHILVTSREILRVAGESVHHLAPLESPPDNANLTAAAVLNFPATRLFVAPSACRGAP